MHRSVRRAVTAVTAGAAAIAASLAILATGTAEAATAPKFPAPEPYGTSIQDDPGHDFSKAIRSRRDGILRGWVTYYDARDRTAEYKPIAWTIGKKGGKVTGYFADPGEYVVMNYRSPVSPKAELYSARNCDGGKVTVNSRGLGTKRCGKAALTAHLKAGKRPALITVYRGEIVRIQEIFVP